MTQDSAPQRNLWSLTVLCLLRARAMHPYEMQRLIREWHKDEFLDLKRGSLYHAIHRLEKAGLIEPVETSREGKRPERTVYRLTAGGEKEGVDWLRDMLARPAREPNQFFAALSFLPVLSPDVVREQVSQRVGHLGEEIATLKAVLANLIPRIGRLVLVEVEYALAMKEAELAWARTLLADLESGKLRWCPENVCPAAAGGAARPADQEGEERCRPKP
jgi:DNA-binding PadR family transcriptional regulator